LQHNEDKEKSRLFPGPFLPFFKGISFKRQQGKGMVFAEQTLFNKE